MEPSPFSEDISDLIILWATSNVIVKSQLQATVEKISSTSNYPAIYHEFILKFYRLQECFALIQINHPNDLIKFANLIDLRIANFKLSFNEIDSAISKFLDLYCQIHGLQSLQNAEFFFLTNEGEIFINYGEIQFTKQSLDLLPNTLEVMHKHSELKGIFLDQAINDKTMGLLLQSDEFNSLYITIDPIGKYSKNTVDVTRQLLNSNKLKFLQFDQYNNITIEGLYVDNGYDVNADLVLGTDYNISSQVHQIILPFYHRSLVSVVEQYPNLDVIGVSLLDDPLEETFESIGHLLYIYPQLEIFTFGNPENLNSYRDKIPNLII